MACIIVSDTHIKSSSDSQFKFMINILSKCNEMNVDKLFLLGDIFDLMIGSYCEYFTLYKEFFDGIEKLVVSGVTIHFFEGNHDFGVSGLFEKFVEYRNLDSTKIHVHKKYEILYIENQKILLSHGDDIESYNILYKAYTLLIRSKLLFFVINGVGFKRLQLIGNSMSYLSRRMNIFKDKLGRKKSCVSNHKRVTKSSIYIGLTNIWNSDRFDVAICGHTHIKEMKKIDNKFKYINVGYPKLTKEFIYLDKNTFNFKSF